MALGLQVLTHPHMSDGQNTHPQVFSVNLIVPEGLDTPNNMY